ncbi:transcription initiation factor TFIID subunit 9 [Caerostris darwini]|uniref:Transcription initiation factor TFIID subunit 9 n=1 Tax=Caerostris darwini TaxID=1538125 RepID=A0AAV4WMN8_9ARAC|nr:transcription initiation factor TFIID subunit 9 [Caerostris darwini]
MANNESLFPFGKSIPKDAQIIDAILKEMNILDYEDRVLNLLLEFTNRYVSGVIDDAQRLASHSNKKIIDVPDVSLAINQQSNRYFITPPNKEITSAMAKHRNNIPLPQIKSSAGLRLPPDRFCLTACNYNLHSPPKKTRTIIRTIPSLPTTPIHKSSGSSSSSNKTSPISSLSASSSPSASKPSTIGSSTP